METTDTNGLDQADMARLAGGQDAALNDLMDRHATKVFHFLYRMLGNEDDANDLAQETFVRVFQHSSRFDPQAKFTTWLYTIAGNLARNHHRWRLRHPNVSLHAPAEDTDHRRGDLLPASDASPAEAVVTTERAEAVRAAVQALPDDMREAVILCEWEDMPVADAAVVLESTPKAVESRLYRARQMLREQLRRWL
jgi:RNA polymerase sigma-70 factor (ECF subfamily)